MKLFEFLKAKEYIEKNPEAKEIPDDVLVEKKEEPAQDKTTITVEELMNELQAIKTLIANKPVEENKTNDDLETLKASVKDLTAEMQKANQLNTDMPKEETADDILSNFMKGV